MRRLVSPRSALVLLAAALPLVALPATAVAKGQQTVRVCGRSACMLTDGPGVVGPLHSTFAPRSAPAPAPFYVVRFEQRAARRHWELWSYIYVPSARAMRSDAFGEGPIRWQDASLIRADLPDLTRLAPYPASLAWGPAARGQSQTPWALVGAVAALLLVAGLLFVCRPSPAPRAKSVSAKRAHL